MDARPKCPIPIRCTAPFSDKIMELPFLQNFKMPSLVVYDGKGDLKAHVDMFNMWMDFKGVFEVAWCRTFPLTLTGMTQAWYARL